MLLAYGVIYLDGFFYLIELGGVSSDPFHCL